MKKYIVILIVIVASMSVNAQSMWNITYDMSTPLGATKEFSDRASFRGFGIDGRQFINQTVTLGGSWSWNVFYENRKEQLYNLEENVEIHGDQFRTGNYMPFMVTSHIYLGEDGGVRPYIGTGVGTIWKEELIQMGTYYVQDDNSWQFGFTPEVGIYVPVGNGGFLFANAKYTYGVSTNKLDATSYINFGVGIGWEIF